jgi:hypothetical protein
VSRRPGENRGGGPVPPRNPCGHNDMTRERSVARELLIAVLGVVIVMVYGVDLIGTPLRLVHVLTIVALGVGAGIAMGRAFAKLRGSH